LFATAGLLARPLVAQTPAAAPAPKPAAPGPAPAATEFVPLRRNVGLFNGRGGTIGWLVNPEAVMVLDTQFPDTAAICLAGLPGRAGRTLDLVLNSHHHGDHTGGNTVFRPATKTIVGHANVPGLMRAAAERAKQSVDPLALPDATFAESWRTTLGDEVVNAKYFGPGHTKGDVVTLFEKANVVHMGDLTFNRVYPAIDRVGGASIRNWIKILEQVAGSYPADAIYVYGHGNPKFGVKGTRGDLLVFRDYLAGLLDYTQQRIAAGDPKEKIAGLENLPGFPDFHLPVGPANRLPSNLSVAYDELTQKSG
jgi:glyoxylase-like metal-dependent hydrolase (beta-lactamase superfamily II)